MSGKQDLEAAIEALADAEDAARSIAGNPSAGQKPKDCADAVLEALPLCISALDAWTEPGPGEPAPPDVVVEPVPPEPVGSDHAPMYVPNLEGLEAAELRSEADVQDFLRSGNANAYYGKVAPGVTVGGLTGDAKGGTVDRPKVLVGGGATLKQARLAKPWLWLHDFAFPAMNSGQSLVVASDNTFVTDCRFDAGDMQGQTFVGHDGRAYRTRIGRCRFASNQRSGNVGDIVQSFSKSVSTNPDYWDVYLCDFATETTKLASDKGGMCLYAEPGIDSGDQANLSPSDPMADYSQHHSLWRRCRVRTAAKFGWYAKHIPDAVDCDMDFSLADGTLLGLSHVMAFRGGSSRGGRIIGCRAACLPYQPGSSTTQRQAFALQSWWHELGACEAVGGCIAVYAYCPHVEGGQPVYGPGNKPLQAAHYAHLWRNRGTLVLGAVRDDGDGGIRPKAPVEGVLVEAHEGDIVDSDGEPVRYDPDSGRITSSHKWIRTERTVDVPESPTGGDECRIRTACDEPERWAVTLGDGDVGPGAPGCVPWDGRDLWPARP